MKTLKITLAIALLAIGFAGKIMANPNEDKISKMTRDVLIEPQKTGSAVTLDLFMKNPENIQSMTIERGTLMGEVFRQIKTVSPTELAKVADGKLSVQDKLPVAENSSVYYRAVVVDKEGVVRYYPAAEVATASK